MSKAVLIVDDEQAIREILSTWLRSAGYETLVAANGLEGLKELYQGHPDLVIADVVMPQIDGFEMCRLIREISGTPIMFLTGIGAEAAQKQGISLGADKYLSKPVERRDLLSTVDSLLQRNYWQRTPPSIEAFRAP